MRDTSLQGSEEIGGRAVWLGMMRFWVDLSSTLHRSVRPTENSILNIHCEQQNRGKLSSMAKSVAREGFFCCLQGGLGHFSPGELATRSYIMGT